MLKTTRDYSKTQIYKLVHKDDTKNHIYVGHTTNWNKRQNNHRSNCYNQNGTKYNLKLYKNIRENGGWHDWLMIWVEDYPCNSEPEAKARERYWYKELRANLNSLEPGRTNKEWYIDNRGKKAEQQKNNYENNKEAIKKYRQKYNEDNKDRIAARNKKYNEDNKDRIAARNKKYLEYKKEKITCEHCGTETSRTHLARHQKTQKCILATKK